MTTKPKYTKRRFDAYNHLTSELLMENELIADICNELDLDRFNLMKTLGSNRDGKSTRDNRHHHKSVYIVEVLEDEEEG